MVDAALWNGVSLVERGNGSEVVALLLMHQAPGGREAGQTSGGSNSIGLLQPAQCQSL